MAIIGGQNNKYVFFYRICLKVEEKSGKNWASSNIILFARGGDGENGGDSVLNFKKKK